jgi:hypothetical protein
MMKFKMPHFDKSVPEWATFNPEIFLWNCFILPARAGIDESQFARIFSSCHPAGVSFSSA